MNMGANTTHFPKVFPWFAATAHALFNGPTIATITGTSTASTAQSFVSIMMIRLPLWRSR
jgi:hypothetical protein